MKKLAIIVASKDFRDEEYFIPQAIFKKEGLPFKIFSDKKGVIIGVYGGEGFAGEEIEKLNVEDFSGVVFVGGPGAAKLLDNEKSYKIAKEALRKNVLLAAICISPTILAKAGVLEGKGATVWNSSMEREPIKILKKFGTRYENKDVVVDGRIITANGPESAEKFAKEIVKGIRGKDLTKKQK